MSPRLLHLKFKMVVKDDEFRSLSSTFNIFMARGDGPWKKRCASFDNKKLR